MQEFALNQAIFFHIFINYALLFISVLHGILLFAFKDFVKINKTSFYLTPLFLGFLFIDFLSGISLWAMMGFEFSTKILLMILANFMFIGEILRVKTLRKARQILRFQAEYVRFAKIAHLLYFAVIAAFVVL